MPDLSKFTVQDAIDYLAPARRTVEAVRQPTGEGDAAEFTLVKWQDDKGILIGDGQFWTGPQACNTRVTLYTPDPFEPKTFTGDSARLIRGSGETWGGPSASAFAKGSVS
jgi:hypothetical protein